ncbi:MAG: glycoside hydrolase family 3 N-terminal domain-containing protein, partial [Acidobacteriota bacterium]
MKNSARSTQIRFALLAAVVLSIVCVSFGLRSAKSSAQTALPYRDPKLPIDARVKDLLGRMTLDEKIAQMMCVWMQKPNDNTAVPKTQLPFGGTFSAELANQKFPNGIGQFARQREWFGPKASAEYANAAQKWLLENTRLGIPAVFHDEILHGAMSGGSTVFPVPLSLSSSWDTDLISRVFTVAARQTRIRGTQQVLGPNMDLAREPRWGRTEETYGEDPYLTSRMVVSLVKAIQGNATYADPIIDDIHVIATGKHFAGHGQPENGTNIGPVNLSERLMRETHFVSFESAVKEANLFSIMPAYHEIDGVPVHANKWMLDTVLRKEWGFKGTVVSDYYAMTQLFERHKVASSLAEAAKQSLQA